MASLQAQTLSSAYTLTIRPPQGAQRPCTAFYFLPIFHVARVNVRACANACNQTCIQHAEVIRVHLVAARSSQICSHRSNTHSHTLTRSALITHQLTRKGTGSEAGGAGQLLARKGTGGEGTGGPSEHAGDSSLLAPVLSSHTSGLSGYNRCAIPTYMGSCAGNVVAVMRAQPCHTRTHTYMGAHCTHAYTPSHTLRYVYLPCTGRGRLRQGTSTHPADRARAAARAM